ncbi:hypothetical protein TNCV_2433461 [Trichonephila clavipes]|nr:hypothetical protein TNCV_2433461 [Trichonephila clavipes]
MPETSLPHLDERTKRFWYAKFESGDESLTNEDPNRSDTVVDNGVLRAIIEKNPGNTVTQAICSRIRNFYNLFPSPKDSGVTFNPATPTSKGESLIDP